MATTYEVKCVGAMILIDGIPDMIPMGKPIPEGVDDEQIQNLLAMGAIQETGSALLANQPGFVSGPTPFGVQAQPYEGPVMGDPNPGAPVGGLTPEEAKAFETTNANPAEEEDDFEAGEATDEEIQEYLEEKKPDVESTLMLAMDSDGEYDPVLVDRVLAAENAREKPRKGVVEALEAASAE